jgi:hypothetical protein
MRSSNYFVEAGAKKNANGTRHPYSSSWDGFNLQFVEANTNLTANQFYTYQINYIGSGNWKVQYKKNSADPWIYLATAGNRYDPYWDVIAGGEGSDTCQHIGQTSPVNNKWRNNLGTWTSWCYSAIWNNVGGYISACSTTNYGWTVRYP